MDSDCILGGKDLKSVGKRLRQARTLLKMQQKAFADHLGISVRSLQNYESGKRQMGTVVLGLLNDIGVNIEYLLDGEEPIITRPGSIYHSPTTIHGELINNATNINVNGAFFASKLIRYVIIYSEQNELSFGTPEEKADFILAACSFFEDKKISYDKINSVKIKNLYAAWEG